ncbi:MAG: hypothetical protein GY856_30645 [bacterium]|nr:hypothetical protein [bacterium]
MSTQGRLRSLAAEARERCAGARKEREKRRGVPPRTGDVFRFEETAELAVLWALVEHDAETRRFLAIAADLNPLLASTDVAVPPESVCGSLSLRCGVEVRLDEGDFDGATWAGSLERAVVEQVREKREEIASGDVAGSLFARETDVDPEYQDWLEDGLEKAQAALLRTRQRREMKASPGKILDFHAPDRTGFYGVPYSLAASILLVVSLGLLAGLVWQQSELKRRRSADQQINLPLVHLALGRVRGEVAPLEFPAAARSCLRLGEASASYPAYRLEIREQDTGALVWASDELTPTKERLTRAEPILLTVLLPRRLFADGGEYRVRLSGLLGGRAAEIEEFLLRAQNE